MKMYILILEDTPDQLAPVVAAHASLACYLQFQEQAAMQRWVKGIFKKVVCKVSQKEFEKAKLLEKGLVLTESSLEHQEVVIAFCPRESFPKNFRFFKMWKPSC